MNNNYLNLEIEKIIQDKELVYPLNIAMACAWILAHLKGINLKVLDMKKSSTLSDYFVLASAENPVQGQAMAEMIMFQMKKYGHEPRTKEGSESAEWVLIDLGSVIVHVFLEVARNIYDLEGLWNQAESIPIPESYYFQTHESEMSEGPYNEFV